MASQIYLYFKDKNELLGEVMTAGFERMGDYIQAEVAKGMGLMNPAEQHRALGRAYARFGLENTAYFRVMFELPTMPHVTDCAMAKDGKGVIGDPHLLVQTVQRAMDEGLYSIRDAQTGALIAWGLVHGLTSLYLSGHLGDAVTSHDTFLDLVEAAMDSWGTGLMPRETNGVEAS